ncbi:MAG: rhomboid family intramembrane serine protease [Acidobacteriia bacterium]|nr:rhomboid family intramembrane serine protease [Terriglobia bacterium]
MVPLPLTDHIRRRTFWFLTLGLIILNTLVFLFELSLGRNINRFVFLFGVIPARYTAHHGVGSLSLGGFLLPILVSMFLHGGWLHLLGNMLFLFVFGRSVEDRFGHLKFLLIYFGAGFAGALLHIVLNAGSRVPTIGASGAIAGVLGAYFISFPSARVTTLIPLLFFFWTVELPAILLLGYWFLIQFFSGFQMLAIQTATGSGVAWWAHVGGFVTGLLLAAVMRPPKRRPVAEFLT